MNAQTASKQLADIWNWAMAACDHMWIIVFCTVLVWCFEICSELFQQSCWRPQPQASIRSINALAHGMIHTWTSGIWRLLGIFQSANSKSSHQSTMFPNGCGCFNVFHGCCLHLHHGNLTFPYISHVSISKEHRQLPCQSYDFWFLDVHGSKDGQIAVWKHWCVLCSSPSSCPFAALQLVKNNSENWVQLYGY